MISEEESREITELVKEHCRYLLHSFYGEVEYPNEDQQKKLAICSILTAQTIGFAVQRIVKELNGVPDQLLTLTRDSAVGIGDTIAAELLVEFCSNGEDTRPDEENPNHALFVTMRGGDA